jgi:hypothetical protein
VIVSPAAGDDGDLVAALDQPHGHLGQVLPGRHHVRVEGLVKEEEGQKEKLKAKDDGLQDYETTDNGPRDH